MGKRERERERERRGKVKVYVSRDVTFDTSLFSTAVISGDSVDILRVWFTAAI
jgi:hypothetical protein